MAIFRELPVLQNVEDSVSSVSDQSVHPDAARPLSPSKAAQILASRKPEWLKIRPPGGETYLKIKEMLRERKLYTVCEEAHCPNLTECWASGTATFMLGGEICTRACRFCAIKTARVPPPLDSQEPFQVAASIATLGLHYVVLTSVDRDDLQDGGAHHIAQTIREIKRLNPKIIIEALVPDFRGNPAAIEMIVDSGLDVYAHNIETVRRLQYRVRDPRAGYEQSLATLRWAKRYAEKTTQESGASVSRRSRLFTKSSIMVGLGEELNEIEQAYNDLRAYDVDVVTLGQYLRPSMQHLPVEKYFSPEEFEDLQKRAEAKNFLYVASGPMVRSSYRAGEFFIQGVIEKERNKVHAI